jgi:hypothetical protein
VSRLAAAVVVGLAAAAAIPSLSTAESSGGRDVTVREKVRAVHFVRQSGATKGDRLATGDRVLTHQLLFDANDRPIGSLFTDCVNVGSAARVFGATLQCTASYRLAGGQLVATGVARLGSPRASAPLVGSGTYRGVRGEVSAGRPARGYATVDVLHVDGR